MKYSVGDDDGLDFIIPADAVSSPFTQALAHAVDVREHQRLGSRSRAHQSVENHRLEKREAQCIGRKGDPLPGMRSDDAQW